MKLLNSLKPWILKNIDSKYFELFGSKYIYLTKIPKNKFDVISDLFPLRIQGNWNSHFELLNVPRLINPNDESTNKNKIEIHFFNHNGRLLNIYKTTMHSELKRTIDLKKISSQLGIYEDGTFAVFHNNKIKKISNSDSFITDRGYVGYENPKFGPIKGYVHGNFDAIAKGTNIKLLGISSFFKKHYRIQYEFTPKNTYELFWVNTSSTNVTIQIISSSISDKNYSIKIKPGGLKSYLFKPSHDSKLTIVSKLNMARPVIFKYMTNSFDVFHG